MNWTSTPTSPGYYWFRQTSHGMLCVEKVGYCGGNLCRLLRNGDALSIEHRYGLEGQWAGPLELPNDPCAMPAGGGA